MLNGLLVGFAVALLIGLLGSERRGSLKGKLLTKTPLSCLFILTAVLQPHPVADYYRFLLIGLCFCLGGDVCLALPQKMMFLLGLVSFLLGHVFYTVGFFRILHLTQEAWIGCVLFMLISARAFVWLQPHLGSMKAPVILYVLVITLMVMGAWAVLCDPSLPLAARILIFTGAFCFYVSDLFVARNRFLKMEFFNRLLGLPLYYSGQFLLAFSVGIL